MNFELTDRGKDYLERVTAFMDECVYPAEPVYEEQMRESGDPHFHPPILEELKAEARSRGLWNLFHPDPEWGPGPDQRRVRAAGRDHGPLAAPGAGGDELQRPRHRQHGGADALRHRGAQGALAAPAAGRRDPLGVRDDRAGRRLQRRHQHRDADRARRRRVRHQRPQVVDVQRAAPALPGADRHGQDRSGRAAAPPAVDAGGPDRHARA